MQYQKRMRNRISDCPERKISMDLQRLKNDKLTRRNNSIHAHKIISVERSGGCLNVATPSYISGGCICLSGVADAADLVAGDYVNLQLTYALSHGSVGRYAVTYLGRTAPQFIPKYGEDMGY